MAVNENVQAGGSGHAQHHRDLAQQGNKLEQQVALVPAAIVAGFADRKIPEFTAPTEDRFYVQFRNDDGSLSPAVIEADELRGIYSRITHQPRSVERAALAADVDHGLLSSVEGVQALDLEGTGWAYAVIFKHPITGVMTVESGIRTDGTVHPPTASSAPDETGPAWMQSGDSMSLGLASRMAMLTGAVWVDNAVGGERSYDTAGRTGSNPIWVAVDGGEIPASGPVNVTPYYNGGSSGFSLTGTLMKQGTKNVNPCRVAGVEGTLAWVEADSRYRFSRSTAGAAVSVPFKEPVITAARDAYQRHNQVIQLGRNNVADLDRVLEDTHSMVQWQTGGRRKFLVVGVMNATNEPSGSGTYNAVVALNTALKREYGFRFVDVRRKLIDDGLAMAGITPTSQDTTDVANDTIPTSLRSDVLHLNDIGKDVQAQVVYARLKAIGWF